MEKLIRIGTDTSKRVFQLHGVDASEAPVLRRKIGRAAALGFYKRLPPTVVAVEACGASHFWARAIAALGHEVRLIAPQLAKPYVRRGKDDAADAEALCEAMSRPTMRFVPVKAADQQAALMQASMRERLVRERTRLANTIRGHALEFGLAAPTGPAQVAPLLAAVAADLRVPALARELFAGLGEEFADVERRVAEADARLRAWHRAGEVSRRLATVPGIGAITAALLAVKVPDPTVFRTARDFAAWLGLTPKDHSTAGKTRLGRITRAGDETVRSLLVVGAASVIRHARAGTGRHQSAWLVALLARKPPKLAAVALADKTARIAWRPLVSGEAYDPGHAAARVAGGVAGGAACGTGMGVGAGAPAAA